MFYATLILFFFYFYFYFSKKKIGFYKLSSRFFISVLFPAFPLWFPAFLLLFRYSRPDSQHPHPYSPHCYSYSLHSHQDPPNSHHSPYSQPDFPHSHPYSSHSHSQSPHFPHSIPPLPILAFTDSRLDCMFIWNILQKFLTITKILHLTLTDQSSALFSFSKEKAFLEIEEFGDLMAPSTKETKTI